jgi:ribosomal protein L7/L12
MTMKDLTVMTQRCQQLRAQGASDEDIISFLRSEGCSKVESIVVIAKLLAVGLDRAKEIVHTSKAWEDVRKQDDRFHASLDVDEEDV